MTNKNDTVVIKDWIYSIYANKELPDNFDNDIDYVISDFVQNEKYISNNVIIYNIIYSIIEKNESVLYENIDAYIDIYMKSNNKISLDLEDKTILFFSDYFINFQSYTSPVFNNVISILLDYYDKDLFFNFMNKYKIPFNLAIREEKKFTSENNEEIITQSYYSLIEVALFNNKFNVVKDLLQVENILEPIKFKVIENNIVYDYVTEPFMDLFHILESHLLFLIDNNVITSSFRFRSADKNNSLYLADAFSFFLEVGYDQCFIKLYRKSKESNPSFDLKNYLADFGLLQYYIFTLREFEADAINIELLNIFREANYSFIEKNSQGLSAIDLLAELPVILTTHIIMSSLDLLTEAERKEEINEVSEKYVEWFNKTDLENHFKKLVKAKVEDRQSSADYIKSMLSDNNHLRKELIINDDVIFDLLHDSFPNFEEVIEFYKGQFKLNKLTGKHRVQPILLLGEAGVGKTHFAKEFSKLLNTGYTFVDMGSLTSNWILSGNNATWKNAKQGKILESLMKSKTINPIILMDELDKARTGEWDPTLVLYQLLEEINAKEFIDEYVDFSFDASSIIYIACANSIKSMSEPLLSRFKIFNIKKPEGNQHNKIISNIYSSAINNAKIFSQELSKDIYTYLESYSLRASKNMIDDAISKVLRGISNEQINQMISDGDKIALKISDFKSNIKPSPFGFD